MTKVSAFVIPSLWESPVSVAAESANAVGAGVDAGTVVVVVVGATVVVVVGAAVVVVGATVVVVGATVDVGAIVVAAMEVFGATEATTGTGGTYPHPDN